MRGISKDEWCKTQPTPGPQTGRHPCGTGCGGSNGDPHLRRSSGSATTSRPRASTSCSDPPDGSIEIQGRQEPPCLTGSASPPPSFGSNCQATINTAVAVKVNGHRIGFYSVGRRARRPSRRQPRRREPRSPPPTWAPGATLDRLSPRLRARPSGRDEAVGAVARRVRGSTSSSSRPDTLPPSGVGLIARSHRTAGLHVPALPDGTALPVPIDRHERYHELYEVLAPAWRVTYVDVAHSTTSPARRRFVPRRGLPPEAAPLLDRRPRPDRACQARTGCAAVTDKDLADQCAYDTAVTGDTRYATLYARATSSRRVGPPTLDLAPARDSAPSLPSTGAAPPSGINLVEDHLANRRRRRPKRSVPTGRSTSRWASRPGVR